MLGGGSLCSAALLDKRGIPAARGGKWSAVEVAYWEQPASLSAEAYPPAEASARRRKTQANVELFASVVLEPPVLLTSLTRAQATPAPLA
jgi:hypothetical protein